jgi:hypothetical protein
MNHTGQTAQCLAKSHHVSENTSLGTSLAGLSFIHPAGVDELVVFDGCFQPFNPP